MAPSFPFASSASDCREIWVNKPPAFNQSDRIFLSQAYIDVLADFNIGQNQLHKVRLLDVDHKTDIADPYYLLNATEKKDT